MPSRAPEAMGAVARVRRGLGGTPHKATQSVFEGWHAGLVAEAFSLLADRAARAPASLRPLWRIADGPRLRQAQLRGALESTGLEARARATRNHRGFCCVLKYHMGVLAHAA